MYKNLLKKTQFYHSQGIIRPLTARSEDDQVQSSISMQLVTYLILGVWFGLISGLAEGFGQVTRIFWLGRIVWRVSPDVIWMAPTANIVLFTVVGFFLFLLARRWPNLVTFRTTIFVLAFLSFHSVLSLRPSLNLYARLLLAIGLAVQISRIIATYPRLFSKIAFPTQWIKLTNKNDEQNGLQKRQSGANEENLISRRDFLLLLAGTAASIAGLAISPKIWQNQLERRTIAALLPAETDMPNVLLIVLDTVRAQSCSLYGYNRLTTPFLEKFAKTGVRFDRAISTSPWTLPSHASMFTGRFPHELFSFRLQPLDDQYPTLAEVLANHGYQTSGFTANLGLTSYLYGLNRGFIHYEDFPISAGQIIHNSYIGREVIENNLTSIGYHQQLVRKHAPTVSHDFLKWLSRRDKKHPFFTFLNYFDAHEPYLPPEEYALRFATKKPRGHIGVDVSELSTQDIWELTSSYDGAISYVDNELELLFSELQQMGLLENTIVILTSDHGEMFGEHGLMTHGNNLYLPVLHVPLLLSFPFGIPSGKVVSELVSLRDIPSTVLDLINLKSEKIFPGDSLTRTWDKGWNTDRAKMDLVFSDVKRNDAHTDQSPVTRGRLVSLIYKNLHYINNFGDGREELYNFEDDPFEERDLASSQEGRQLAEQFRVSLEAIIKS